ncbi:MAG: amino acid adenylation domain-containing protein/thioester reductase-like protein [Alteromonadaceae bacterium]
MTGLPWQLTLPQSTKAPGVIAHQQLPAGPAQDMVFIHQANPEGSIELILFANANIYHQSTAHNWLSALSDRASTLAQRRFDSTQGLPLLTPREIRWLDQRQSQPEQWPAPTFHQAFSQMAIAHPEQIALKYTDTRYKNNSNRDKTITYKAMEQLTNTLARQLISTGIGGGKPVAVLTERSADLPVIALAIFKAGGCYLPLSIELPTERMAYICQDAKPSALIVLDDHPIPLALAALPALKFSANRLSWLSLDKPPLPDFSEKSQFETSSYQLPAVSGEHSAYIIYTSGSTGTPKGVVLTHQGWNNFAHGVAQKLTVKAADNVLLCASVSFDGWLSDVGMAWVSGASLVPVTREQMNDIERVKTLIKQFDVSHAVLPPSYLRLFDHQGFEQVNSLMTIGEPPQAKDVEFFCDKLNYYNGYGPTENTGASCIGRLRKDHSGHITMDSGTPLDNVQVYILDQQLRLLPPGSIGFIYTAGDSLGQGYLNLPDKTAETFINSPYGRVYNTGDLGRWNHEGLIEILGRADTQVKLRGQRVELTEIEAKLEQYPGIQQAAVLVANDSNGVQSLWAFVVQQGNCPEPSQADWQQFISQSLPGYMIPAAVFTVPQMPQTIAGKLDQAALLQQIEHLRQLTHQYHSINRTPPATDTEQHIAQIWQNLFPDSQIAREDDFFALGGDSLRAIGLITTLRNDYQCSINQLYENPILVDFAASCQPRPAHLVRALTAAKEHWQQHMAQITSYEQSRQQALAAPVAQYRSQNKACEQLDLSQKRHYRHILLTGATGYLGSYLLHNLLQTTDAHIYLIIRATDNQGAKERLSAVLQHYFQQPQLAEHHRLTLWCGDLRQQHLGLSDDQYQHLARTIDAIYHSAANVNHFGHYHELYASNVTATANLITLAATSPDTNHKITKPSADFHHISTISVVGEAPQSGFQLFSEYSQVPQTLADNYYTRTKQLAEKLVIEARSQIDNACIHRVGNVVFAAEDPVMQKGVSSNAFFRQLAALIQIGKVPDDMHVWLCHVDYLAQAIITISQPKAMVNQTHHLEHHYRHTVADLLTHQQIQQPQPQPCDFVEFIQRLIDTHQQPHLAKAHGELVDVFGLMRAKAPQVNGRRIEVITERTQSILKQLNFTWPDVPLAGLKQLLSNAHSHFSPENQTTANNETGKSTC